MKVWRIKLTTKGEEIGKYLLGRHEIIHEFLRNLGLRILCLKIQSL